MNKKKRVSAVDTVVRVNEPLSALLGLVRLAERRRFEKETGA